RTHLELVKDLTEAFPQGPLADALLPRGHKLGTTKLLGLVYQEGEQHQHRQHYRQVLVGDLAVAMVFFHALGAMDFWGREILGAVEGQQIIAIQKSQIFQGLVVNQSGEDISEGGPELFGVDRIKDFSQASITGYPTQWQSAKKGQSPF